MQKQYTEADWKLFRKKITNWQEQYMEKLIQEYILLLNSKDNASDKFWALEKRIKQDKKHKGVICEMRRSQLIYNLTSLIHEGAITYDDLDEFSETLKETIRAYTIIDFYNSNPT